MAHAQNGDVNMGNSSTEIISSLESRYITLLEAKVTQLESHFKKGRIEPDNSDKAEDDSEDADETTDLGNEVIGTTVSSGSTNGRTGLQKEEEDESRYCIIVSQWDSRKGEFKDSASGIKDEIFGPKQRSKRAFTFRKLTGITTPSSEIDIQFPPLQKLLGRLTSKWGWSEEVTKCRAPYYPLIYAWDEAQQEANDIVDGESDDDKQARSDLREMLKIISTSSGDLRLDQYLRERANLTSEETITHATLWTLFPPGTLVLGRPCHDEPQVFFVDSCDGFVGDDDPFEIILYSFDWNGSEFSRVPFEMKIGSWGGDRKRIVELPFFPLKFYEREGLSREDAIKDIKNKLEERGDRFREFCTAERGKQMFNYTDGVAYFNRQAGFLKGSEMDQDYEHGSRRSGSSSSANASTSLSWASWKSTTGAMIVDFSSYMTYQSGKVPILGPLRRYEGAVNELSPERRSKQVFQDMYRFTWDGHPPSREMTPEQRLCCPPRVLGYALKQKTWVQLLVKHLGQPDKADLQTFKDKLQLDDDAKDLISNSVKAHEKAKQRGRNGQPKGLEDFAAGKGRGLVIMLYGQPGVGKTLTAESVAQMTGKPLLSVGVSDIGIEGDKAEMNLEKVFALAGLWEAVLLFDEADVFLESRGEGDNDLRRNAMVSVLLRVLEYYDGILILTTNRMRSLDIAVQSRIHLAVRFGDLSSQQKIAIFDEFLEQLHGKQLVKDLGDLKDWVKTEGRRFDFNGRQIRNIVSTALGIAQALNRNLERRDMASVARQTEDFKKDLITQEAIYKDRQIKSHS